MYRLRYFLVPFVLLTLFSACATHVPPDPEYAIIDSKNLPVPNFSADIAGLSPCTNAADTTLHLNSDEPVNVIVHGCFGSAALFRSLAQVFAFHGQQAICFNYNDRDSMMQSSSELINALGVLSQRMDNKQLTVIGHSQGGLIARKALINEREDHLRVLDKSIQLVTISAPYAGISAADHCSSTTMRWLTLGLIVPICKIVSGDKWYEITNPSPFIQKPGTMLEQVTNHLKIVTDERGSCRKYNESGNCVEDDFVFSTQEQYFPKVDSPPLVENVEVAAGHAEIVGDYRVAPEKLIKLLQQKGVMHTTPPDRVEKLSFLLQQLYRTQNKFLGSDHAK